MTDSTIAQEIKIMQDEINEFIAKKVKKIESLTGLKIEPYVTGEGLFKFAITVK